MTTVEQLTKELEDQAAKRNAIKAENSVTNDFPEVSRNRTYRKSISIRSL